MNIKKLLKESSLTDKAAKEFHSHIEGFKPCNRKREGSSVEYDSSDRFMFKT